MQRTTEKAKYQVNAQSAVSCVIALIRHAFPTGLEVELVFTFVRSIKALDHRTMSAWLVLLRDEETHTKIF